MGVTRSSKALLLPPPPSLPPSLLLLALPLRSLLRSPLLLSPLSSLYQAGWKSSLMSSMSSPSMTSLRLPCAWLEVGAVLLLGATGASLPPRPLAKPLSAAVIGSALGIRLLAPMLPAEREKEGQGGGREEERDRK